MVQITTRGVSRQLVFGLVLGGSVLAAGLVYRFHQRQRAWIRQEQVRTLSNIADIKVAAITAWRRERLADGSGVPSSPAFVAFVRDYLAGRGGPLAEREIRKYFDLLKANHAYHNLCLFDAAGKLRLASGPVSRGFEQRHSSAIAGALRLRSVSFSDFQVDKDGSIYLGVTGGMYDDRGSPVAAIYFQIDPAAFLYDQIRFWPTPSRTGETLLVRRDGAQVLFLNELRHRTGTALKFKLPLNGSELPAARAVLGFKGWLEARDYRGVPVLAVTRDVPDSPWFLVTKIDQSEVYSGLAARTEEFAIIVVLALTVFGCTVILLFIRRDLARRKRAEEQLLAAHEELNAIHGNAPVALLVVDQSLRVQKVNEVGAKLVGRKPAELLGLRPGEAIGCQNAEPDGCGRGLSCGRCALRSAVADTIENGTRHEHVEAWLPLNVGGQESRRCLLVSTAPLRINGCTRALVCLQDLTERKQAEAALRESEERVRRKLENIVSPEGDIGELELSDVIDAEAIQSLMQDFYQLTGIPTAIIDLKGTVVVGVGWQEVCTRFHRQHPETCRYCIESDTELTAGVAPGEFKLYHCKNNLWDAATPLMVGANHVGNIFTGQFFFEGERIDVDLFRAQANRYGFTEAEYLSALDKVPRLNRSTVDAAITFLMKLGQMLSRLSYGNIQLARSLAERDRLMADVRALNADLEHRVQDRTAQLETSNRELEAFAYSVSHDLRAPLRGIDGWSLALQEDYGEQLDESARKYLNRVRSEASRMGVLIDDLLHLSRVTRSEMQSGFVDLTVLARGITARLREEHPDRDLEFLIEPELTATGDARLLEIALTNLLGNAVKFTGTRARARIELGRMRQNGESVFYVRDNGVGFDMNYAGALFGAFQRLHKSSEFPGTGIGLATVQRIVRRHGGRVWAEAEPDRGATFYFAIRSQRELRETGSSDRRQSQ